MSPESAPDPDPARAPEPFTDEWVQWLASRLAGLRVDGSTDLIVQHRVVDEAGSEFCWHVRLEDGSVAVAAGLAEERPSGPSRVTFTSDSETARSIATEGASAQRAFLESRLSLNGDIELLIGARPALEAVAKALARRTDPRGGPT